MAGRSHVPAQTTDSAPLEARVLEARNTIFSQELWHELNREARTLTAHDVQSSASTLTCPLDATSHITVELMSLQDEASSSADLPSNDLAETFAVSLHLLLSYSHRFNEFMRIRPKPPYVPSSRGQQPYTLLRAIIARMQFTNETHSSTTYLGGLVRALQAAGLPATLTLRTAQLSLPDANSPNPNQVAPAQHLVRSLLQPQEFSVELSLRPDLSLTIRGRTFLSPVLTTYYHVVAPAESDLHVVCPPYKDGYRGLRSLAEYLRTAVPRMLVHGFLARLPAEVEWVPNLHGTAVHVLDGEDKQLAFALEEDADTKASTLALSSSGVEQTMVWPGETRSLENAVMDAAAKLLEA